MTSRPFFAPDVSLTRLCVKVSPVTDNNTANHTSTDTTTVPEADRQLAAEFRDALREGLHMVRLLDHQGTFTLTQLGLLGSLSDEPHSISMLARMSGMTQPGMTQQIDKLEDAGLVRRVRSTKDARVTLVELTIRGRETLERESEVRNDALAAHFDLLDEEGRQAIGGALEPLTRFGRDFIRRAAEEQRKNL